MIGEVREVERGEISILKANENCYLIDSTTSESDKVPLVLAVSSSCNLEIQKNCIIEITEMPEPLVCTSAITVL